MVGTAPQLFWAVTSLYLSTKSLTTSLSFLSLYSPVERSLVLVHLPNVITNSYLNDALDCSGLAEFSFT